MKLITHEHDGCPAYQITSVDAASGTAKDNCTRLYGDDTRLLQFLKPEAIIIANRSANPQSILDDDGNPLDRGWRRPPLGSKEADGVGRSNSGTKVAVITDEPSLRTDPATCILAKKDVAPCETAKAPGMLKSARC